ncbi:putative G patch domain-containing protein 2 [Apostichopus japonicus]|uniref:Putative G patch domain-containing protein 2 n=1 Tax=Stichopus japonicus TaxID=307972 RepID=A0A2G8JED8_STIJA|nr:putative G patch domain-containing protein 2 [Apostichopus japonicus]
MEVLNYEAIEDRFGNKKKVPQRSKTPSKGQKLTAQNMEIDCETVNCRTSSPEVAGVCRSRVTEGPLAESRTQSSSSDGTISRTDDRAESAMSGDDDDTSETLLGRDASCSSESSEDDGLFTNDEGREADDEQSDFFHEPGGSVAGVSAHHTLVGEITKDKEDEEKFYKILNGALPLLNKGTQKNFNSRLKNLQNRDDCSNFRSLRSRFKPKRLRKTSAPGQLNDRVVRFLKKPNTNEIDLQTLRKTKHQSHLDHVASIYSLDLQTNTKAFLNRHEEKTQVTSKLTNEGKVGGSAAPIPESNVGNQMLQNMGWKPGTGLGAKGRGVKEPVQVFIRPKNRGLGHWKPS